MSSTTTISISEAVRFASSPQVLAGGGTNSLRTFSASLPAQCACAEIPPLKSDQQFVRALARRTRGGTDLFRPPLSPRHHGIFASARRATSMFPLASAHSSRTSPNWADEIRIRTHGLISRKTGPSFCRRSCRFRCVLSDSATLRDYNPQAFLTNLLWNTRGETQSFLFGPGDRQDIAPFLARTEMRASTRSAEPWPGSLPVQASRRRLRSGPHSAALEAEASRKAASFGHESAGTYLVFARGVSRPPFEVRPARSSTITGSQAPLWRGPGDARPGGLAAFCRN